MSSRIIRQPIRFAFYFLCAQDHALGKLYTLVDSHWAEAADSIAAIESLADAGSKLAAAVASKVYYHLEAYTEAVRLALAAGDLFDVDGRSEYVETIVGALRCGILERGQLFVRFVCPPAWLLINQSIHPSRQSLPSRLQPAVSTSTRLPRSPTTRHRSSSTRARQPRVGTMGTRVRQQPPQQHLWWSPSTLAWLPWWTACSGAASRTARSPL